MSERSPSAAPTSSSAPVQPAEPAASRAESVDEGVSEVNVGTPSSGFVDDAAIVASEGPAEPSCGGIIFEPERIPIDMYFLVDSSGSMAEPTALGASKWDVMAQALIGFSSDPRSAEMGMGMGFFPETGSAGAPSCTLIPLINLCIPNGTDPNLSELGSCLASDYAPAVPLSIPSDPSALIAGIQQRGLGGTTPTSAALQGTYEYLESFAQQNPGRRVVTVLATDGDPTACEPGTADTIGDVAALAAAALAGPSHIQTFVIGVGQSLANLARVAEAGGTDRPFLTDTSADLASELADAFEAIRASATPCAFQIPDSTTRGVIDTSQVNVRVKPGGTEAATVIPMTSDGAAAGCSLAGGWYYDDPRAPQTVELCASTCSAAFNADVELQFGCETIVREPQ